MTGIPENKCYLNLLRKTIASMLANHGFLIREVLVNKEKEIALVLTLPEEIIKKEASRLNLNKPIDFGLADLLSLEPVDQKGRPMRMNQCIYDERVWNLLYRGQMDSESLRQLRLTILELVTKDCNMKKVIRLARSKWMDEPHENFADIYSHAQVPLGQWEQFRGYLVELSVHVRHIELLETKVRLIQQSFYGDSRMVARGNVSRNYLDDLEIVKLVNRLVMRAMLQCKDQFQLKNIWDLAMKPQLDYSFPFECPNSHMRPHTKKFYDLIWADFSFHYPHEQEEFNEARKLMAGSADYIDDGARHPLEDLEIYHYAFSKSERLKVSHALVSLSNPDREDP